MSPARKRALLTAAAVILGDIENDPEHLHRDYTENLHGQPLTERQTDATVRELRKIAESLQKRARGRR